MIRVLDPTTAVVRAGQPAPLPTVYVADRLLVRGDQAWNGLDPRVRGRLEELGWELAPLAQPRRRGRYDVRAKLESVRPVAHELRARNDRPGPPPDAWTLLQELAAAAPELAACFELDHVLTAAGGGYWGGIGGGYWGGIGGGYWGGIGGGYWGGIGGGYWGGIGAPGPAEFGMPGYGGRTPVALVVADPSRTAPRLKRPPVVVMPDTGIGKHPWFPRERTGELRRLPAAFAPASRPVTVHGSPVPDESSGVSAPLTGDLDRLAGHGTFIAGIVRQTCPAARLEAHAVMSSAGVMLEDELLDLLHDLLERQLQALAGGDPARVVDVLSLSVGYYHEQPEDALSDTSVASVLRDLGQVGVLVVAGAGNDATDRKFLPAGFAGQVTGLERDALPLLSVGSLNPSPGTVSLFSNAGKWVTTYRPGAAIVSTLPVSEDAAGQASTLAAAGTPDERRRGTIDRDDFSGGFGVWSGTSFAAPVLSGQLAQALVELGPDEAGLEALLERGWQAVERVLDDPAVRRP